MTNRATITLDPEAHDFLVKSGGPNRSSYINRLLLEEKNRTLAQALLQANREEAADAQNAVEAALWDVTLSDGLK